MVAILLQEYSNVSSINVKGMLAGSSSFLARWLCFSGFGKGQFLYRDGFCGRFVYTDNFINLNIVNLGAVILNVFNLNISRVCQVRFNSSATELYRAAR